MSALTGPENLDDEALEAIVADLVRLRSRLDATTAQFVARWDARALWGSDGSRAPGARLGRDAGCCGKTASARVRVARHARHMPVAAEAWKEGRVSSDHVRRMGNARSPDRAERFADVEADLVTVAETGDWATFERAVAMFESSADDERTDPTNPEDLKERDRRDRGHRNPRISHVGRRFELGGSLDQTGGEEFRTAWERIVQEMWETDMAEARNRVGPGAGAHDVSRTAGERRADALVEMARRASVTPAGAQPPRPLITVVVSLGELSGPIRETFNGLVLSHLDVARLLTEADFERIVFAPTGQPVEVASPHRFFTGAWRRAIEIRDRRCQHPTCDEPAERCQVDHIIEATDGGPTAVTNGRLLCPTHNRQRPGRRSRGDSGRASTSDGDDGDDGDDVDDPGRP